MALADLGLQPLEAAGRLGVLGPGGVVVVIVAEVGGDDDGGLRPAPQLLQRLGDLARRRLADEYRKHLDVAQGPLDEGQVHLQAMLADEGLGRDGDAGLAGQGVAGGAVDGHGAEGRPPGVGRRQRHAAHRHPVGGAEQHHAFDFALAPRQQAIGRSGDVAGIDVAGMGRDHRLGRHLRRRRLGQAGVHALGELVRIGRIEQAGDPGGLDGRAHRPTVRGR